MILFIFGTVFLAFIGLAGVILFRFYKQNVQNEENKEKFVPTTQDNLPLDYIRAGIVALKNGSFLAIVELPSINIDLMEASEKQVVLEQYRQILTSIDFPFQFLQQSRVVDVTDYLKKLEGVSRQTKSTFIKKQLSYYSNYIKDLVKTRSVLTKRFFLVVSFDEELEKRKRGQGPSGLTDLSVGTKKSSKNDKSDVLKDEEKFDKAKKQLSSRISLIKRSFSRFDITPKQLNDEDLTELFYTSYNKERSVYQSIKGVNNNDYTSIYVKGDE